MVLTSFALGAYTVEKNSPASNASDRGRDADLAWALVVFKPLEGQYFLSLLRTAQSSQPLEMHERTPLVD